MFKLFFEDLTIGQKSQYGTYPVTKEEVIEFASKYDPQSFHIDEQLAKHSIFGALCASGWHTCSMMMRMMVDEMKAKGLAGMGSPGIDNLRWLKPVFPDDILSISAEITELRGSKSRPNIGLVKEENTILNQKGEAVMKLVSNYMVLKRD